MKDDLASQLMCRSKVIRECNLEVAIFSGDDDAASIPKVRESCDHLVVKLSYSNHIGKGITSASYSLKVECKELTTAAIEYLKVSFTFAVAQNIGDAEGLSKSICAIPRHAFNNNDLCEVWCDYARDKENHEHEAIPDGLSDENLYQKLMDLFDNMANNARKFAHGVSIQKN